MYATSSVLVQRDKILSGFCIFRLLIISTAKHKVVSTPITIRICRSRIGKDIKFPQRCHVHLRMVLPDLWQPISFLRVSVVSFLLELKC